MYDFNNNETFLYHFVIIYKSFGGSPLPALIFTSLTLHNLDADFGKHILLILFLHLPVQLLRAPHSPTLKLSLELDGHEVDRLHHGHGLIHGCALLDQGTEEVEHLFSLVQLFGEG